MMAPERIAIYHITDVANLSGILAEAGLHSDARMAQRAQPAKIGYDHIKARRMTQLRVACCGNRYVGEFVPFNFCPRSPMLFTINLGNTGRSPGCQKDIVHLVSTVALGTGLGRAWAISDGNAGAYYATFGAKLSFLKTLDWPAIQARDWRGMVHQKAAEFLVADFFPWDAIVEIGCHNENTRKNVLTLINDQSYQPTVVTHPEWYY